MPPAQGELSGDPVAALTQLSRGHVVCVGDIMLDRFVYGAVERISPEAPIPVVRVERTTAMLGGAGNVVRNLSALGCPSTLVSIVGLDAEAGEVRALLADQPATAACLVEDADRPTTLKSRFVAGAQQLLRADRETDAPLTDAQATAAVDHVANALPAAGALMLSDYGKGVLGPATLRRLIDLAASATVPVVVDPTGTDYAVYAGAALLTPNRFELQRATRMPVATASDVVAAARTIIADCRVGAVLVTRGAEGMTLVVGTGEPHHFSALAQEVFDVSGAGDTVAAVIAAGLAGGLDLQISAYLANVAAGVAVSKIGTAAVSAAEIARAIRGEPAAKVVTRDAVVALVNHWRGQGWRVGFTNGCFDLLHPGHVSLIQQSAAACDRLIVALNSDASVRRLKGADRPVQPETARAQVMASISGVDAIVIFDEDTPLTLIEELAPDVLIKGADYTVDEVVGADVVQRAGGQVVLIPLAGGHSTTATIARMAPEV